jgi:hypothetical protein
MEIYNFVHGVKFFSPPDIDNLDVFYGKRQAHVELNKTEGFCVRDNMFYQLATYFKRADVTAIFNNGIPIAIPATDSLLFDLLTLYLYTEAAPVDQLVPISGVNYNTLLTDNGKTFLFDVPGTPKTFTIISGLPIGWKCEVVKMYAASTITVVGSGGMIVSGLDLVLNGQYAKMQILVTGANSALAFNIGG